MFLRIPPLLRIDWRGNGNSVRQLQAPAWSGEGSTEEFQQGRIQGITITRARETVSTLVITNTAQPCEGFDYVLRLPVRDASPEGAISDFSHAKWLSHPEMCLPLATHEEFIAEARATRESWRGAFTARREEPVLNIEGLRPPQIGAIFAVQSHWTVNTDVATVVLPTSVGKTETMLAILVAEQCERLLVVVPTDALRTQIAEKFLTLGFLKLPQFGIVSANARFPVVGLLNHRPKDRNEVDSLFEKCNVVVTTMPLAGQCKPEVTARMAELCPCLFIDEAHHVAAPKWKEFKAAFAASRIVQFTATPFRNDDRPIGGRRIFTFSLRNAQQQQGYFKPITFQPVVEFSPEKKDRAIAEAAVAQLRKDQHLAIS